MIKKLSDNPIERMMAWYKDEDVDPPHPEFKRVVDLYRKDQERARVGIAVIVRKGSAVLVGRRRDEKGRSRGHNTWALPGGHLEYKESIEDCAKREILEETGLEITDIRQGPYVNNIFGEDGRHYVTLFVTAELVDYNAEPVVMEPEKCFEWRWCFRRDDLKRGWTTIPEPRFPPLENFMKQYDLFLGSPLQPY